MIHLMDQPFDPADALKTFETEIDGAGAVVSFTGYVRPKAGADTVRTLHLQAYAPMTEKDIERAAKRAQARWPLTAFHIIHRIGDLSPGDPIVFVATASHHRRAAFEAADFLMDYLKTQAIFWKKEITDKSARWVEPRTEDYQDNARWEQGKAKTWPD